jgi:drug/metabolite transporter (DMT)-like permease
VSGWLFLAVAVAFSTILWPVARWGLAGDAKPATAGFWTSLAMALVALCAARFDLRGAPAGVWVAGGLLAIAYSVGFWVLIMQCLKIGPAGPTVTVNNMAMVCGVLYGVLWLKPRGWPHPLVIAGAVGACAALVLIGLGGRSSATSTPRRWLPMVLAGGAFSGVSFICQTYVGEVQRPFRFAFLAIGAFGSAMILLPLTWSTLWRRREMTAGITIGAMSGIGMALTLAAFADLGSAIVLPFSVTTPVLLMLVIGHFAYEERLGRTQMAGCIIGAGSVLLLALGSG